MWKFAKKSKKHQLHVNVDVQVILLPITLRFPATITRVPEDKEEKRVSEIRIGSQFTRHTVHVFRCYILSTGGTCKWTWNMWSEHAIGAKITP